MKIYANKTNEHFCCSIRKIKEIFSNTQIHIDFGTLGKNYCTSIQDRNHYFCKKNINGQVIVSLQMVNGMTCPILSFYPIKLKKAEYDNIKNMFEDTILSNVYSFYMEHLNANKDNYEYILLVDLVGNEMEIKTGRL